MLTNLWNVFMDITDIVLIVCVFILAPMCIFRRSRTLAATGLYASSYVFRVGAWIYAVTVAFAIWGALGVTIGFVLAGIGVVPIAMLAALFHGEWFTFWSIVFWVGLTFGTRALSIWAANKTQPDLSVVPREF
jgi:hypothetical protein